MACSDHGARRYGPPHFIGAAADRLCMGPTHHMSIGIEQTGPDTAELAACIWAVLLAFKYSSQSVTICYDCGSAALVGRILTSMKPADQACRLLQGLILLLTTRIDVRFQHTHSHQGRPLNELADALFTRADNGRCQWSTAGPAPFRGWCAGS